ncbi:unnamed protein product [Symbiodinium pilosum]|uniref:Methyltransferase domain-containing protein n=1 Tax=Symbiodinium pilosum TaxID=2952 RepID=A0A812LGY6_SYMPI|nr:unnamed protein product [Symbiodinium pilosum]
MFFAHIGALARGHAWITQARIALQIVDLGCGRGSLVGELRNWGYLAVGLDANPILTATLNEYGLVADVTQNLSFTISTAHPRCAPWLELQGLVALFMLPTDN